MALTTAGESRSREPGKEPAVLVIEPNEEHQVLSTMALGRRGFRVTVAGTAREGIRLALSQAFVAVVLDFKVRDMPALDVLSLLAERLPEVPKIFVVTSGQEPIAVRALASGASGYLVKTARYNELLPSEVETQVRAAVARRRLKEHERALGESEDRFQKAFRASPAAIAITTRAESRFIDANDAFLRLLGRTRDEVLGHTTAEIDYLVADPALEREQQLLEKEGAVRDAEVHVRTRDRGIRTATVSIETVDIEGESCYLRLFRDVTEDRQVERLRDALYEILDATQSASGLPDLFRRIHEVVAKLMPARNCYIALHDPATDELSFPYFVDEKEPAPAPYRAGQGLTEYVLRTGEPLLVSPSTLADLVARQVVEEVGVRGIDWLGVPLNASGRTIGVLAVQSYAETIRYTEADKQALWMVSAQVALSIDRMRSDEAVRRAEARFRAIFSDAPMGIALVDAEGRLREANPSFGRMTGRTPGELRGMSLREITHPSDADRSAQALRDHMGGSRPGLLYEKRYLRIDGTAFWARVTDTVLRLDGSGSPTLLAIVEDITAAKATQEAREADARRFESILAKASDGISLVGPDGTITWQSASTTKMFGFRPEEAYGRPGLEFVHPDDLEAVGPGFLDLLATPGKTLIAEVRIKRKDGAWQWTEVVGTNLLRDPDLQAIIFNYRDITERNEALEQIRFQASLLSQVRNAVIAIDRDRRIVYWNEAAASMYGWKLPEVLGQSVTELLLAPESQAQADAVLRAGNEAGHWEGERRMRRRDGSTFPAEVSLTALRDLHDEIIGYVGVSSDVTDRVTARHELEIRARQQAAIATLGRKALVETSPSRLMNEAVHLLAETLEADYAAVLERLPGEAGFTIKASKGWEIPAGTRLPDVPGANMAGYALAIKAPAVLEDAETETRFAVEPLLAGRAIRSGMAVPIPGPKGPYGVLCVHTRAKRAFTQDDVHFGESIANVIADAQERSRIERILGENERMASMGQLAAYVAHEVNTPLTNISLLASSVARREKDPEVLQKLEAIGDQRRRATAIIKDILEFPRQRSSRRVPEDVRKVIVAAIEQIAPFRKPDVEVRVETGDHAVFANVDVIQIRDVLVNLLKNALEATVAGRVTVLLKEWPDFLFISVADTGSGLPPEALEALFHPLSSMRTAAEGQAVGLAVSRSIVAAHGGKIEAISEVGKGSTFTVVLPRFEEH